jgi:hypothetical protein
MDIQERETKQKRMRSAYGEPSQNSLCNRQSSHQIWYCWGPASLDAGSYWEIYGVDKFISSGARSVPTDNIRRRTLHKIYTFIKEQQDGKTIKQFFRNNETSGLLRDCTAGLAHAQEVFEV